MAILVVSVVAVFMSIIIGFVGAAVVSNKSPEYESAERDYKYQWNQTYNQWLAGGWPPSSAEEMANYFNKPPKTPKTPAAGPILISVAIVLGFGGLAVIAVAVVKLSSTRAHRPSALSIQALTPTAERKCMKCGFVDANPSVFCRNCGYQYLVQE